MTAPGEKGGGLGNDEHSSANAAGCRAALAWRSQTPRLAPEHHDAQVVGSGLQMHGTAGAAEIVEAFLATPFSDSERRAHRIRLIADFKATGNALPMSVS